MFLGELARRAKALDPIEMFREAIEETKEYIVDLNTSQLSKGKDSKGDDLDTYASATYAEFKKSIGSEAPLGIPNLLLEGDFHSGFNAKADNDANVFITSTDSKSNKLKAKYGDDIFGLTDESKSDLKTVILPTYLKKLKDALLR